MERALKYFFFLSLLACTSAPSVNKLTYRESIQHQECLNPLSQLSVPFPQKVQNALFQTTGVTGSLLVTSVGVVSDTVVASGGIAGLYLCADGNGGSGCGDLMGAYFGVMEDLDLLWTTKKAYKGTSSWRCPYVDHISRAMRKVSTCIHDNGEFVAAFEQLNRLDTDDVMALCSSEFEKEKVRNLKVEVLRFPQ